MGILYTPLNPLYYFYVTSLFCYLSQTKKELLKIALLYLNAK
ncbi:hypothetical protein N42_0734 [Lactococcus lactis subsp. lactis]|uniref:Uncharacterized protein n=1 Tax=Lactococcus lactis subsp. lactis TaxID=1360 RepID=A0A0V8EQN3_LACLL|nr:hypothetical protein N42_0734 [Lactococcus lactis subsp. lactis]